MASLIIFQIFTKAAQGAGLLPTYAAVCGLNLLPTLKVVAWVDFSRFVCVFVCLSVFPHDISIKKTLQRNDSEMFHHEFWKLIYLGVKGEKSKSRGTKNSAGAVMALS